MRRFRLAGLLVVLLGSGLSVRAQRLYIPALVSPLSAYEYHDGTYQTTDGSEHAATLKLMAKLDRKAQRKLRSETYEYTGGRAPAGGIRDERRYATMVVKSRNGPVKLDSVVGFTFDKRRFIHLGQLLPGPALVSLRGHLETEFVEVFVDTGRIQLYGYYPTHGNRFALASSLPGVIHENDLVRSFIWRRRGAGGFEVMVHVPPRGFSEDFERQLRSLFSDRPDIVKYIDSHDVRREDLPATVRAYNSGVPFRFE